jgi:hypothetical protein
VIKLTDILKEIGDASSTVYGDLEPTWANHDWLTNNGYYKYEFTTESGLEYAVHILKSVVAYEKRPVMTTEFIVAFEVKGRGWETETNKGELYKVMATVVNFAKKVVESDKSMKDKTQKVIVFVPAKKDKEDNRRLNLYMAYVKKQIPNAKVKGPDAEGRVEVYL